MQDGWWAGKDAPRRGMGRALAVAAFALLVWARCAGDGGLGPRSIGLRAAPTEPPSRTRIDERDRYAAQAIEFRDQGRWREAIGAATKMLAIERELFDRLHDDIFESLDILVDLHGDADEFREAMRLCDELLALRRERFGADDWRVANARLKRARLERLHAMEPETRSRARDAKKLADRVWTLYDEGRYAEALPDAERALALHSDLFGNADRTIADHLNNLASLHIAMGNGSKAEPLLRRALDVARTTIGDDHPDTAACFNNLALLYDSMGRYAEAEPLYRRSLEICEKVLGPSHPHTALNLNNLASLARALGKLDEAAALFERALKIQRGGEEPDESGAVVTLNNLGLVYQWQCDFERAESCFQESIRIGEAARGAEHPAIAKHVVNLGSLYADVGDLVRAEPLLDRGWKMQRDHLGAEHPDTIAAQNSLALLHSDLGNTARAVSLMSEGLSILEDDSDTNPRDLAGMLNNLADVRETMGDIEMAQALYERSLAMLEGALGKDHLEVAKVRSNLATLLGARGMTADAERLLEQSLATQREALGDSHPGTADILNNLGALFESSGQLDRALPYLERSLAAYRESLGPNHPKTIFSMTNLAIWHMSKGDLPEAERLMRESHALEVATFGGEHPRTAETKRLLARILAKRGDDAGAESLLREAIPVMRRLIETSASVQSQRQQLAMVKTARRFLDSYVAVSASSGSHADSAYDQVLQWKGSVFSRQRAMRTLRDDTTTEPRSAELASLTRRLASLALRTPAPAERDAWRRRIDDWSRRKEAIEAELAAKNESYRLARSPVTAESVRTSLPSDAVLVDYLEYVPIRRSTDPVPAKGTRQLVAFVVRRDAPLRLVPLGDAAPIAPAVAAWRASYGQTESGREAGVVLRTRLWDPIEPYVGDAEIIVVSPDGAMAGVPFAALPAKAAGDRYLVEERTFALVPAAQGLPAMFDDGPRPSAEKNLLLIGGVDYDRAADAIEPADAVGSIGSERSARRFGPRFTRDGVLGPFAPLDGTLEEIEAVEKLYRHTFGNDRVTTLRKADAGERAFWRESPRHAYLHIATHGFFAAGERETADVDRSNGFDEDDAWAANAPRNAVASNPLSGLVLAGANRPPAESESDAGMIDGFVTAEEVGTADLRGVALVTLSACETGLGTLARGEGVLGLQRAFQVAGADTVMASLWKVDDDQTRALMERFYRNLWDRDLPTHEALREAQLWMLNQGPRRGEPRAAAQSDSDSDSEPPRGVVREKSESKTLAQRGAVRERAGAQDASNRASPYYWAPFVLSGDWR